MEGLQPLPWGSRQFYKMLEKIHIHELKEYERVLEDSLSKRLEQFKHTIEETAATLPEEEKSDFYSFYSDEYSQLSEGFPTILRTSLFITCCSVLEYRLKNLCKHIEKKSKKPFNNRGNISTLQKYQRYLERYGCVLERHDWEELYLYYKLRNTLVHDIGELDLLMQCKVFTSLGNEMEKQKITRNKRFEGQEIVANFIASKELIHVDNNSRIQLSKGFCCEFIEKIENFFDKIYGTLPDKFFD